MMEYPAGKNDLYSLILQAIEGQISQSDFVQLENYLKESAEYREIYSDLSIMCAYLRRPALTFDIDEEQNIIFDANLWQALAEYEKAAPGIETQRQHQPELIQKVIYPPREKRKLSKFSIFMLLNTAAIILFFIFLHFATLKAGVEVATMTDSLNAEWVNVDGPMGKGTRIVTGDERLILYRGYAKLLFDNHALVTVEGPAEFQVLNDDRICLNYGKLYLKIPKEAIGFSVYTQNAKIIDMGTEFGVLAELGGGTQLHVLKGKTMLMAGRTSKVNMEIREGAAKKVSDDLGEITDIQCGQNYFVRDIDSKEGMVWKGDNLSLASIVAGRDGFQEVGPLIGLDPVKGEFVTSMSVVDEYWKSNNAYNAVPNLQFIDGVFVPDGESGPIQITSLGHTFECPNTSGKYTHGIAAYEGSIENQQTTIPPVIINGQEIINDPILVLHSNAGITFDLQAIRQSLPQLKLEGFKATGIPLKEFKIQDFVFGVLVDGQIKYERKIVMNDGERDPIPFHVEISPNDRFLTLIITDGLRAKDDEREYPYAYDFFYLINPELCLTNSLRR